MKTCRECEFYIMMPTIVDGICKKTSKEKHIDDTCDYEISEHQMSFHKEVDEKIKDNK